MNLIDEAESLMLYQFSASQKLKALIRALVKPFYDADNEIAKLRNGHCIAQAQGATLNIIGSIVGQPRNDMSDEEYRPWIKVAICLNNSTGSAETVFTVLNILFGKKPPIQMEEYPPNDVVFTFFEYPKFSTTTLFAIVRSAMPIGTTCQFIKAASGARLKVELSKATLSVFRFDHTAFSASFLADFFKETSDERD